MAEIRNAQEIGAAFRLVLHLLKPDMDSGDAALLADIVGQPAQIGGELIYQDLGLIQDLHRIDYLSGDDLRERAKNYGVSVSPGQTAEVDVIFFRNNPPTADVQIPADNREGASTDELEAPLEYATKASTTMFAAQASSYFVPDRGRYEIVNRVQCLDPGTAGNVGSGRIVEILDSIVGMDGCVNLTAATGGTDEDSDEVIRENVKLAILGLILTTREGLRKFALANQFGYDFGFADAQVINVNDVDSERPTGTDLFAVSTSTVEVTQVVSYSGGIVDVTPSFKPVLAVSGVVSAGSGALTEGTHWEFYRDSTSTARFSTQSLDRVRLLGGWPFPDTVTLTYSYADGVAETQDTLALSRFRANSDNVFVKKGIEHLVYFTVQASFFANTDTDLEKSNVESAVSSFLSAYRLGDPLQESDLVIVFQQGYGDFPVTAVDQVIFVNWYSVDELGVTHTPVSEEIELSRKEYARLGGITFV